MLSHPVHAMRPRDHVLSQQVLEFLIEHQDHFLVGMQLVSPLLLIDAFIVSHGRR
jgi:hypothetical protein